MKKIDLAKAVAVNFAEYAKEVVQDRAITRIDGLKPVQRRILYSMWAMGLRSNTPHKKAARIVGDVLGKYHPHGDCLDGDTLVYTLDGKLLPIRSLVGTDSIWVLAYDEKTNKAVPAKAKAWRIGQHTQKTYTVKFFGDSFVEATANHQFFVHSRGWVQACKIRCGDEVISADISRATYPPTQSPVLANLTVSEVKINQYETIRPMYDFTVDGHNNMFIVVGSNPSEYRLVVAHNSSVYGAAVLMAQTFSYLHPLIDGQGNFGTIDGDPAAAMRYTEMRLTPLAETMLEDIDEGTIPWQANFDTSLQEPIVLPTRFPNALVNGTSGIAVGMKTSILPHNLAEVCKAICYIVTNWNKRKKITAKDLMEFVQGPDFPTGGVLYRYRLDPETGQKVDSIEQAYSTGQANFIVEGVSTEVREKGNPKSLVFTELPFKVEKGGTVIAQIGKNRQDLRKSYGLTGVADESGEDGIRLRLDCAKGSDIDKLRGRLFQKTSLRVTLQHQVLALVEEDGKLLPKCLSLPELLINFVEFRLGVIVARSKHHLKKAKATLHLAEGMLLAIDKIDLVVSIIRKSKTAEGASKLLQKVIGLTEIQAEAVLSIQLRRLVRMEKDKLNEKVSGLKKEIARLSKILSSEGETLKVVELETLDLISRFGKPRQTKILATVVTK